MHRLRLWALAVILFSFPSAADEADQLPPRWSVDGRFFLHSTFEFTTSGYISGWLTDLQTGKTDSLFTVTMAPCTEFYGIDTPAKVKVCTADNDKKLKSALSMLEDKRFKRGWQAAEYSVSPSGDTSTAQFHAGESQLTAVRGEVQGTLANDTKVSVRIAASAGGELRERDVGTKRGKVSFKTSWSPDGQWLAVRDAEEFDPFVVVAGIPRVDVLDAGAGSKVEALTKRLTTAGYKPAHQGKAGTPRTTTEIFVAKGFESDGARIAAALELPKESVKELTWATPYAVTIAAGSEK